MRKNGSPRAALEFFDQRLDTHAWRRAELALLVACSTCVSVQLSIEMCRSPRHIGLRLAVVDVTALDLGGNGGRSRAPPVSVPQRPGPLLHLRYRRQPGRR